MHVSARNSSEEMKATLKAFILNLARNLARHEYEQFQALRQILFSQAYVWLYG